MYAHPASSPTGVLTLQAEPVKPLLLFLNSFAFLIHSLLSLFPFSVSPEGALFLFSNNWFPRPRSEPLGQALLGRWRHFHKLLGRLLGSTVAS